RMNRSHNGSPSQISVPDWNVRSRSVRKQEVPEPQEATQDGDFERLLDVPGEDTARRCRAPRTRRGQPSPTTWASFRTRTGAQGKFPRRSRIAPDSTKRPEGLSLPNEDP